MSCAFSVRVVASRTAASVGSRSVRRAVDAELEQAQLVSPVLREQPLGLV
jgi:hypothetical protein